MIYSQKVRAGLWGPKRSGECGFVEIERLSMDKIAERLEAVEENIEQACQKAGRARQSVKLVVVTKSVSIEQIQHVVKLGYSELGENRVQQLRKVSQKMDEYLLAFDEKKQTQIKWHMIGHLQRKKVRKLLPIVGLIHSVDTLRLAEEINEAAQKQNKKIEVLLQVNTSNEPQKYGAPVGAATHLAEQMMGLDNLKLTGLMTMAPLTKNKDIVRSCFARSREIFEEIRTDVVGRQFAELSMGMSADYKIAVEQGATILRIGSAIFAG